MERGKRTHARDGWGEWIMPGQMGLSGRIGATLNDLARRPEVEKALEIGTYNGEGSTYCIADGLSRSTGRLCSIEADRQLYEHAQAFFTGTGLPVELHYGLTLALEDYAPYEHFVPAIEQTSYEVVAPGTHREWYEHELELARSAERTNVLDDLLSRDHWYDMVLLDGGEYSAEAEFHRLEPHVRNYVVLDDTNPRRSIKNAANREWLLWSPDWDVVIDEPDDRCGWCVGKRR